MPPPDTDNRETEGIGAMLDPSRVILTPEQQNAVDGIVEWARSRPFGQHMTLGGLAGTGKTTLVRYVYDELRALGMASAIATPTGKAAHVLMKKGLFARTIHSMIYECIGQDAKGQPVFSYLGLDGGAPILIVDEASMVNQTVHDDIMRTGVPVLYVGDYGQLPPVGTDPGIMRDPDIRLREIHRQAQDNPIVRLAYHFREGYQPKTFAADGKHVRIMPQADYDEAFAHEAMVCGLNRTRSMLNRYYLELRDGIDLAHERLDEGDSFEAICLRNNRRERIVNGMTGRMTIKGRTFVDNVFAVEFRPDGEDRVVEVRADLSPVFTGSVDYQPGVTAFDLAYALTCHKVQGSEFERVTVLDEAFGEPEDQCRWRYTATTRAKESLCWLI